MESLSRSDSRRIPHQPFLRRLHDQGLEHGAAWLRDCGPALEGRSTIDVKGLFG